jgi:hypothetical protein
MTVNTTFNNFLKLIRVLLNQQELFLSKTNKAKKEAMTSKKQYKANKLLFAIQHKKKLYKKRLSP